VEAPAVRRSGRPSLTPAGQARRARDRRARRVSGRARRARPGRVDPRRSQGARNRRALVDLRHGDPVRAARRSEQGGGAVALSNAVPRGRRRRGRARVGRGHRVRVRRGSALPARGAARRLRGGLRRDAHGARHGGARFRGGHLGVCARPRARSRRAGRSVLRPLVARGDVSPRALRSPRLRARSRVAFRSAAAVRRHAFRFVPRRARARSERASAFPHPGAPFVSLEPSSAKPSAP
jgi:hypothetical protein